MAAGNPPRVLVVDDDPRVGRQIVAILTRRHYEVCVVPVDGIDLSDRAVELARSFHPHIAYR